MNYDASGQLVIGYCLDGSPLFDNWALDGFVKESFGFSDVELRDFKALDRSTDDTTASRP